MPILSPCVIFDIDGTLSDNIARQNILHKNKRDWDSFFAAMGEDLPNEAVVEIYNIIKQSEKYKMVIVSARPKKYRVLTEQWLFWNKIDFDFLYLRNDGDTRPDSDVKFEILKEIKKEFDIRFVFDDRSSVVKMWRDAGLTCFQCYDHNY